MRQLQGGYPALCTRKGLGSVRRKLLTHQRHQQSGFTPKKSTVDRTIAFRVLTERLRDFRTELFAAYVDLRKAFDSVNLVVLSRILALREIPPNLVNLTFSLYSILWAALAPSRTSGMCSCPNKFQHLPEPCTGKDVGEVGLRGVFGTVRITDLDFADDAIRKKQPTFYRILESLSEDAEPLGL